KLHDNNVIINQENYIPYEYVISLLNDSRYNYKIEWIIHGSLIDKIIINDNNLYNYLENNDIKWLFKLSTNQINLLMKNVFIKNQYNTNNEKLADLIMHLGLHGEISINKKLINKPNDSC